MGHAVKADTTMTESVIFSLCRRLVIIAGASFLLLEILIGASSMRSDSNKEMQATRLAQEQIDRFRAGQAFSGDVQAYLVAGQPDPGALNVFAEALDQEPEAVRVEVANLLISLGRQVDPLKASGGHLIRNPRIIHLLAQKGLSRVGQARDECLGVLVRSAPGALLRDDGPALTETLERFPDNSSLLLVAKAKPEAALPVVKELARSPRWAKSENVPIALAALGEKTVEEKFVRDFLTTHDPSQKAKLAKSLGYIGTETALRALASQMRTDLVVEMPRVSRRSVRLDILAALSYNFPDKPFLWDNAILDDSGYARVEQFCEETFGTKWQTPRPPFLTIQGFPSEPPR
jgi:HEAT repeat protein